MADMELVIKIPEELYNRFGHEYREENLISKYTNDAILEAFCNGTLLPKGHGRLVDLDQMCHDYWDGNYMEIHFDDLDNIKTIVEEDTESEEKRCIY